MNGWILRWVLNIIALIVIAAILPHFQLTLWAAIVSSVFLGIINAAIRPLITFFTLPFNVITLLVTTVILNAVLLWITSVTVKGFDLTSFWWGILAALLYSVLSFVISYFIYDRKYWR